MPYPTSAPHPRRSAITAHLLGAVLLAVGCDGGPAEPACTSAEGACVGPNPVVLAPGEAIRLTVTPVRGHRVAGMDAWLGDWEGASDPLYPLDAPVRVGYSDGTVTALRAGRGRLVVNVGVEPAVGHGVQVDLPVVVRGIAIRDVGDTVRVFRYDTDWAAAANASALPTPRVVDVSPAGHAVLWATDDARVATVSAAGVLTAQGAGTTQLVVRARDVPALPTRKITVVVTRCAEPGFSHGYVVCRRGA